MNNTFTKEALTAWIAGLKEAAKNDEQFEVSKFIPTKHSRFSIIGGWVDGYLPNFADLFCASKSDPSRVLCVAVADNEDTAPEAALINSHIVLEWEDDPEAVAEFFMYEWERKMEATGEMLYE
jgi:hypothetical protein